MREKMGTLSYSRICPCCRTIVRITTDEMNFHGVTSVLCPMCGMGIRFTSDLGFILSDVTTNYDREFKRYEKARNKRRQSQDHD